MSTTAPTRWTETAMLRRVRSRYRFERAFRFTGLLAISLSVLFLAFLLYNMGSKGLGGFSQFEAQLPRTSFPFNVKLFMTFKAGDREQVFDFTFRKYSVSP